MKRKSGKKFSPAQFLALSFLAAVMGEDKQLSKLVSKLSYSHEIATLHSE